ncbi:MAG: ABC transporter ATP-binding protein [Pegethrix bostrychoides GSE-TBD4-15B]|jgi:ABC-type Fe3+/spermidine/putrescine transport system ATPase subunit|uniref:ABC transporter ATP-binding protein n=1 Tax=Pegethrix bostrychoides GSE-TBD4-15B TaxID=2839662 RepID=A0A951P9N9_9CYAN|nr:ABC transporter ATP-binding protein [Pegethrix bostrychoides GSE-TBD4-15B]
MMDSPDSLVYLDGVSKLYATPQGLLPAVRQVTLDVRAGEFYSLLGSSGSGKTTTLRLIGGFEIPDSGRVMLGGEDVTQLPPHRRNLHTVFQNYALFPHLNVAQNIAYPLKIAQLPSAEIKLRVEAALEMFRITGLGERRPAQLSGGQQQRVALARALIGRPKVLLLDEPLSALDAKIREEVRQELRELQRQTNLTFIYVTHDQEEALALSDRVAVMQQGRVEQVGSPREIYDCPASLFVAQFIGKANFLTGRVLQTDPLTVMVQNLPIRASAMGYQPQLDETVTLMIRPEQLQIAESQPDAAPTAVQAATQAAAQLSVNQLSGRVIGDTYVGQLLQVQIETALGRLTATVLGKASLSSEVNLTWLVSACTVIPPALATMPSP